MPDKSGHKVVAYASIQLENNYRITHIRVIESPEGSLKVEMPSVKGKEGYSDVVHALNEETRKEYREEILREVKRGNYSESSVISHE